MLSGTTQRQAMRRRSMDLRARGYPTAPAPAPTPSETLGGGAVVGFWTLRLPREHTPGMGVRGRIFLSAAIIHVYVCFCVLRALTIRTWWVLDASQLPKNSSEIHGAGSDSVVGLSENSAGVKTTTTLEVVLLSVALFLSFSTQICILLRLVEFKVKLSAIVSIVATALQSLFILISLITFSRRLSPNFNTEQDPHKYVASQGHVAAIAANVCSIVTFFLLVADAIVNRLSNQNLAKSRRKLLASLIFASWVIALGGVSFKYIEDWEFANAYSFSVVTLTTIGYGNVAPATKAGKIFLIFYFLLGAGVIGFLISAMQDAMVARALEMSIWRNKMRHHRIFIQDRVASDQQKSEKAAAMSPETSQTTTSTSETTDTTSSDPRSVFKRVYAWFFPSLDDNYTKAAEKVAEVRRKTLERRATAKKSQQSRTSAATTAAAAAAALEFDESTASTLNDLADDTTTTTDLELDEDDNDNDYDDATAGGRVSVLTSTTAMGGSEIEIEDTTSSFNNNNNNTAAAAANSIRDQIDIEEFMQRDMERRKLFACLFSILAWWLIVAYVFTRTEPTWTYIEAVYFAFVTMTTIGYGDVVPTSPVTWEAWYIYVFVSIALVTTLVAGVGDGLGGRVGRIAARAQESRRVREQERRRRRRERSNFVKEPLPPAAGLQSVIS